MFINSPYSFGSGYRANAVLFDGANTYLRRTADLTDISDGKEGTISFWFKLTSLTSGYIVYQNSGRFRVDYNSSTGAVRVLARGTTGTTILSIATTSSTFATGTWYHFLASWNMAGNKYIYISNSADLATTTFTNSTIDYTTGGLYIGSSDTVSDLFAGSLAELWFDPSYLDISDSNNRALFISSNKPVSLGSTGELPTGSQPLLYLNGNAANIEINAGTGGNFSTNGLFSNASNSPSG